MGGEEVFGIGVVGFAILIGVAVILVVRHRRLQTSSERMWAQVEEILHPRKENR